MGGSEALARQIAVGLNRNGSYDSVVYAVDHGGPMAEVLRNDGVPYRIFSRTGRLDLKLIRRLTEQLRADKIQVVHTHHLCQLMYAGIAGRLARARVVHTEHEFYSLSGPRSRRLLRVLSGIADTVTAVSEPVTEFLTTTVGIPARKLKTITSGVDVSRFSSAVPLRRSALGWRDDDIVIGCVARLEPEKSHELLLEAVREVRKRLPHTRLLLMGDGGERERLLAIAQALGLNGSIKFLGIRGDIPELLGTCNLVALASSREGLPIALLEAMAAGKPVVATRVGSVPELVKDGQTGVLVPPGDVDAMVSALHGLISDPDKSQRFGKQALAVVQARYSFKQTLEQYDAVYRAVLSVRQN
jgi:glycosyltransferase involved in cell wall biosynthesis